VLKSWSCQDRHGRFVEEEREKHLQGRIRECSKLKKEGKLNKKIQGIVGRGGREDEFSGAQGKGGEAVRMGAERDFRKEKFSLTNENKHWP